MKTVTARVPLTFSSALSDLFTCFKLRDVTSLWLGQIILDLDGSVWLHRGHTTLGKWLEEALCAGIDRWSFQKRLLHMQERHTDIQLYYTNAFNFSLFSQRGVKMAHVTSLNWHRWNCLHRACPKMHTQWSDLTAGDNCEAFAMKWSRFILIW